MRVCFILLLLSFVVSCQSTKTSEITVSENENVNVNNNSLMTNQKLVTNDEIVNTTTFICEGKKFNLMLVEDSVRKTSSLNIAMNEEVKGKITLPDPSRYNNFVVDLEDKTKDGFKFSIQYGSKVHIYKVFNFVCEQDRFYLSKITTESFDKTDPENSSEEKEIIIKPHLPIEKFLVTDYMNN